MTPQILPVDDELRLRRYGGGEDIDVAWPSYRDPQTVTLVDGPGSPTYSRDRVAAMFETLRTQGEVYLVERLMSDDWVVIGDVTLAADTLPIVIAPEHRSEGIGRRVLLRLVDRARVLGWSELRVRQVLPGNDAAHRLFSGLGFVACSAPPPAYVLRLAPLGFRPRP